MGATSCPPVPLSFYLTIGTAVLWLITPVLASSTSANASGNTDVKLVFEGLGYTNRTCEFKTHDLELTLGKPKNLTLFIEGDAIGENITLIFVTDGDILKPIPNITIGADEMKNATVLSIVAANIGRTVLATKTYPENLTDVSRAFVRILVPHSEAIDYISDVVGWMYFVAWSVSFYPQTYSNWQRKSVIGLHFDFLSLNTVGFFVYSVFNICLYCIASIEAEYFKRHPYGVNPVQLNDVIFSVHAFFACCVQIFQCLIYDRGDQQISKTAKSILSTIGLVSAIMVLLSILYVVTWLNFLYYLSYVKLFITLIKYIPQAYYNYRRKSTSGWSIGNILLDFTGGLLSIAQMFILAYNYSDWSSIFGDPTKFGLGLFSIIFDIFFMVQHYVLYRGNATYQRICESPAPAHVSPLTESAASSVDYGSTGSVY